MNPIEKYFGAERLACLVGAGVGFVALIAAAYFFFYVRKPFYTGMAFPLIVLGLFFLIICAGVVVRSPKDISRVKDMIKENRNMIQAEEKPRMERVMRNFRVIIIVEISLIAISIAALFLLASPSWRGAFVAILVMASFLLVFDWFAEMRGKEYVEYLETIK